MVYLYQKGTFCSFLKEPLHIKETQISPVLPKENARGYEEPIYTSRTVHIDKKKIVIECFSYDEPITDVEFPISLLKALLVLGDDDIRVLYTLLEKSYKYLQFDLPWVKVLLNEWKEHFKD